MKRDENVTICSIYITPQRGTNQKVKKKNKILPCRILPCQIKKEEEEALPLYIYYDYQELKKKECIVLFCQLLKERRRRQSFSTSPQKNTKKHLTPQVVPS